MSPKLEIDNAERIASFLEQHREYLDTQETNPAFEFAFTDADFMTRPETRGIRFQLELLKPDLALKDWGVKHTIVVFGSARFKDKETAERLLKEATTPEEIAKAQLHVKNSHHYETAREFSRLVSKFNATQASKDTMLYVCTGGGPGVMEGANRGAHEEGDLSIGLNISLPHEQTHNPFITPDLSFKFHYFAIRKMHFLIRARAIVSFPGGFGTLDELFETLTLMQTKKIKKYPIVLVNEEFWRSSINFDYLASVGVINQKDLDLLYFCETADQAFNYIKDWYALSDTNPIRTPRKS